MSAFGLPCASCSLSRAAPVLESQRPTLILLYKIFRVYPLKACELHVLQENGHSNILIVLEIEFRKYMPILTYKTQE